MWMGIGIAAAAALLVTALMVSWVQMELHAGRQGQDDKYFLKVRALYGLLHYTMHIPKIKFMGLGGVMVHTDNRSSLNPDGEENKMKINHETVWQWIQDMRRLLRSVDRFPEWLRHMLRHMRCVKLEWSTRIGLNDAADTAFAAGLIWSVKSALSGLALQFVKVDAVPRFKVEPLYNRERFATDLDCILKIRLGHAMVAGLLLFLRILRVKGGLRTWQNILFKA